MATSDIVQHAPTARELSKEEYDQWVTTAFSDQLVIKEGLLEARAGLWKSAEALSRFSETSGWLALGYETVGEWLADPDITLTRATYFRMLQAWRELHVLRGVAVSTLRQLDLSKTQIVLPALKEGRATLQDALDDIEALGARDLREKYTGIDGPAIPPGFEPTGDGLEEDSPLADKPPLIVDPSDDLSTDQVLLAALLRVMLELGAPELNAMSIPLRETVQSAIEFAYERGVEFDARP
jgi:hypothetical protein